MQINLIPKTKEKELQQKRTDFLIISSAVLVFIATAILVLVLFGINLTKKNTIANLDKSISETKNSIAKYSKLEKNVTSMILGLDSVKNILDKRPNWINLYKEIGLLMPKEDFLTETSSQGNGITLKAKTTSVDKVAELIESLRNYETPINPGDLTKVKLFSNVDVSNFTKESQSGKTYYTFDIKATFTEEIWKKM